MSYLFFIYFCCRWAVQHEIIEKINMQAVLNASAQEDEFVKDFLISCDKVYHFGFINFFFFNTLCHF